MLKVYFDTNVYSDITKGTDLEFIKRVYDLSEKQVSFFYSQAHLSDLMSDKTDHKYQELKTIEAIAGGNFLHRDNKNNQIISTSIKAKEAFEDYSEVQDDEGIFSSEYLRDPEFDLLKMQSIDLGPDVENILTEDDKAPSKAFFDKFGITKRHYTIEEWLPIADKMKRISENQPELLKKVRSWSKQHLQVGKFNIKIGNVNFDENLAQSEIGKSFKQMLDQQIGTLPDGLKNFYVEFISGFNMINFLGFDYEKNKKVRFISTNNDAQHSYYGSASDIIVSRDKGLLNKSKFMYFSYDINTEVMGTNEFKTFLKNYRP